MNAPPAVDLVLPAHNEGDGIALFLEEFHSRVQRAGIPLRFVVSEDGSKDNTVEVIEQLSEHLPITLLSEPGRKGYSRAVIDGLAHTTAELVAFTDSDGQCDPEFFAPLYWTLVDHDDVDMVVGYRAPRSDPGYRRLMSAAFKLAFRAMFPVDLHDPSCPFLVVRRPALERIMKGELGLLRQGFWWEFNARARAAGMKVIEVPIRHRDRLAGETKVYRPTKIPTIAAEHLWALGRLRNELKHTAGDAAA